jgi:predicted  nucleic acid-binding Zn-ribbon protein
LAGQHGPDIEAGQGEPLAREIKSQNQDALFTDDFIREDDEPVRLAPQPLPEPASEGELDPLRYELRSAQRELNRDKSRLVVLRQAIERARAERHAEAEAAAEAVRALRHARQHSRAHLIEAYLDGQPTASVMSEADAQAALAIRAGHLQHAEDVIEALRSEIAEIENGLPQRRRDIAIAAGALISRSGEFLDLLRRVFSAFADLRDVRLTLAELRGLVTLDDHLCWLIDCDQPSSAGPWGGYPTDEKFLSDWTDAVARLLGDADAPLPDPNGSSGINSNPSVRGRECHRGDDGPTRSLSAVPPVDCGGRAAQRRGCPPVAVPSSARERDPATGKWLAKEKWLIEARCRSEKGV